METTNLDTRSKRQQALRAAIQRCRVLMRAAKRAQDLKLHHSYRNQKNFLTKQLRQIERAPKGQNHAKH